MTNATGDTGSPDLSVWLLGNSHPNADRSIGWDADPLPNLGDPDMLLVDLTTLTPPVLERIGREKLEQAQPLIRDKILNRGIVVVMTQATLFAGPFHLLDKNTSSIPRSYLDDPLIYSNYQIFPTRLTTRKVPKGKAIVVDRGHNFKEYADSVREFSFYIGDYCPRIVSDTDTGSTKIELAPMDGQRIKDNSGHDLGLTLTAVVVDHYNGTSAPFKNAGQLVFLPPPSEPAGVAIGRILSACGKTAPHAEAPPAWAERLSPGPAGRYRVRIAELEALKAKIQDEIDGLVSLHDGTMAHCRLLYSDGPELEDAVVEAFRILGFDDIERMGKADEEDAAFAMGNGTRYSHAVVEAKGADRGIQKRDILQCRGWAARRAAADGRPMKGILVPNQHRLKAYPKSSKTRMKIEPNQLEQAETDDVCIIPSCALFEAVSKVLGGETPDRARIVGRIAATRGVLADVL